MIRRTLVLVAALVTAVFAFTAVPAHAGGPTSVLLSAPPSVVAVGYDDQRYADLQSSIQGPVSADSGQGEHGAGRFIRAAWLIHDMSVWRIDVIYPEAAGGPWIATEEFTTDTKPAAPTWHRAADPAKLLRILGSFKLLTSKFDGGPTFDFYATYAPTPTPAAVVEETPVSTQAQATTTAFTGWRWIIPGVLVGAVMTLVGVRLLPKRRDWQLVDAE
jgi:hypothetical protein